MCSCANQIIDLLISMPKIYLYTGKIVQDDQRIHKRTLQYRILTTVPGTIQGERYKQMTQTLCHSQLSAEQFE